MIILDKINHKVDLVFAKQSNGSPDWVQLTVFHQRSDTEWINKVVRLDKSSALLLAAKILEHYPEGDESDTLPSA